MEHNESCEQRLAGALEKIATLEQRINTLEAENLELSKGQWVIDRCGDDDWELD